jgi:hypothetical protein
LLDIIISLIIVLLFNLFFKFKVVFYTIHRLSIAAIHYNENCRRQQPVTENGDLCYNISYPKAKKGTEAMVKPRNGPPTYGKFFHFLEDTFYALVCTCIWIDTIP